MIAPTKRTKPIVRWPGGKSRLLKNILPRIPAHECYGEVFGGGLAVLGAKPRSPLEIVNDVNGDLIALYLTVQRHLPEVLRQVEMLVCSRELLFSYAAQPGMTDIDRAVRFLLCNRTSFAGKGASFGVTHVARPGECVMSRQRIKALLEAMHTRLDGVVIERLSWERFLDLYDRPNAFFFLDPPYIDAPTGAYDGWTENPARALARRVRKLKAKWMVTINDSPLTHELFTGCRIEAVTTYSSLGNRAVSKSTFGELIITP